VAAIENRTFAEIAVGDTAALSRAVTNDDVLAYAALSGDLNPIHVDAEFARANLFHKVVAHGNFAVMLISALIGTRLPGPGTVFLSQTTNFRRPVEPGDTLTVSVTVREKAEAGRRVVLDCLIVNQSGETVLDGVAEVAAPRRKILREAMVLPALRLGAGES
jgi:acyl dehydratase